MLPKKYRLSRAQFGKVFNASKPLHSGHFSIKWTDSLSNKEPQFAVVVSKKVSRSSVERNRIRRRCYEVLRELLPRVPENVTGIIFVRLRAPPFRPKVFKEELEKLFLRAGIIPRL